MKRNNKRKVFLCSLILILAVTAGVTIAYLTMRTNKVTNTFSAAFVTTDIEEEIDNHVKNDVKVKNTGDIDAYIRAAVVVTWQNAAGDVWGTMPVEGTDYSIEWTLDNWFVGSDGFYYYKNPVEPEESTKILFTECQIKEGVNAPEENYYLNVEILASGIQAEPKTTVESVWGVTTEEIEADGSKVIVMKSK